MFKRWIESKIGQNWPKNFIHAIIHVNYGSWMDRMSHRGARAQPEGRTPL